jgi:hypothetical protein
MTTKATGRTRARPTRVRETKTAASKRAFLAAYAVSGNVSLSAMAAKIDRRTHYKWLDADAAYTESFYEAGEAAADALESEARRRAVDGVERPVYQGGVMVGTVTEYSDNLLTFLLKGVRPEKYRERIHLLTEDAVDAEIRRLEAEVARRSATGQAAPPA